MHHSVGLLHYGEHTERLAQQREFLCVNAELAGLGEESEALDSDNVAYVQQLFPNRVVHGLVFIRADLVALHINLDAPCRVLNFSE